MSPAAIAPGAYVRVLGRAAGPCYFEGLVLAETIDGELLIRCDYDSRPAWFESRVGDVLAVPASGRVQEVADSEEDLGAARAAFGLYSQEAPL